MARTATHVAKAGHWTNIPKIEGSAFSPTNIKTMNHDALLIFSIFGLNPHLRKKSETCQKTIDVRHYYRLKIK